MGIILAILALFLLIVIFILETIFSIFYRTKKRHWYQLVSDRMYRKAKLIDVFANYLFPDFWNWLFGKDGYKFGRIGETLSSVLGKKKIENTLNWFGLFFYYFLYAVDYKSWKLKGHCIRWRMTEIEINEFFK